MNFFPLGEIIDRSLGSDLFDKTKVKGKKERKMLEDKKGDLHQTERSKIRNEKKVVGIPYANNWS